MCPRSGVGSLVALAVGLTAACAPSDGPRRSGDPALDADIRVSPTPAVVGESRVFVRATDGGEAVSGAELTVRSVAIDTTGGGVPAPPGALPPAADHLLPEVDGAVGEGGAEPHLHGRSLSATRPSSTTMPAAAGRGTGTRVSTRSTGAT